VVEFDGLHHARRPSAGEIDPFSQETATDQELGRQTMTTGIPTVSNPVTLAMRNPTGARRSARFRV
jgi:hypothetical protein